VAKLGDFELDIDLLISLVEARPVLWDKTDDIYRDRNETKKAWREVCSSSRRLRSSRTVFLHRRAAARYRALASIIPGRERFSWNLSF